MIEPLRSRASFDQLSKHGRRRHGRWCWVRYAPLPDTVEDHADVCQIGYAIGKNVGNAVVRNRIRRRIRPILVAEAASLAPGIYLLGAKNDQAALISYEELRDDLQQVLAAVSRAPNS